MDEYRQMQESQWYHAYRLMFFCTKLPLVRRSFICRHCSRVTVEFHLAHHCPPRSVSLPSPSTWPSSLVYTHRQIQIGHSLLCKPARGGDWWWAVSRLSVKKENTAGETGGEMPTEMPTEMPPTHFPPLSGRGRRGSGCTAACFGVRDHAVTEHSNIVDRSLDNRSLSCSVDNAIFSSVSRKYWLGHKPPSGLLRRAQFRRVHKYRTGWVSGRWVAPRSYPGRGVGVWIAARRAWVPYLSH